jgi:nucleotide-binding universal stress UspA family protein
MDDKIIVGSDGSPTAKQAVDEAVRLARALGAEVHVVMSNKSLGGAHLVGAPEGAKPVYGNMQEGLGHAIVDEAVAEARIAGLHAEGHVIDNRDAADALLYVADEVGGSMIVVGNKGMSGGRRLLGSVPNKVSHEAKCNVLIVATS